MGTSSSKIDNCLPCIFGERLNANRSEHLGRDLVEVDALRSSHTGDQPEMAMNDVLDEGNSPEERSRVEHKVGS